MPGVSYNASIPTDGLTFLLDRTNPRCYVSGTTCLDLGSNAATGNLTNVVVGSNYFEFNGIDSKINFPGLASNTSKVTTQAKDFSITVMANSITPYVCSWVDKFTGTGYRFTVSSGSVGLEIRTPYQSYGTVNTVANGAWAHIGVTYTLSSNTLVFYINGDRKDVYSGWTAPQTDIGQAFNIGFAPNNPYYAKGQLGVAAVYQRVLSDAEMRQFFTAYKGRYGL